MEEYLVRRCGVIRWSATYLMPVTTKSGFWATGIGALGLGGTGILDWKKRLEKPSDDGMDPDSPDNQH